MNDPALVRDMHDLGETLEERYELLERHAAVLGEPAAQRDALDELHRDPHQAVILDAECVDVRCVGVIDLTREQRFSREALRLHVAANGSLVQDLHHSSTAKCLLRRAVDGAEASAVESLAQREPAEHATGEIIDVRHPAGTLTSGSRIRDLISLSRRQRRNSAGHYLSAM